MTTTDKLRKHYDVLSHRERLALLVEAMEREDEGEMRSLWQSLPVKTYRLSDPEFTETFEGMMDAAMVFCHRSNQNQPLVVGSNPASVVGKKRYRKDPSVGFIIPAKMGRSQSCPFFGPSLDGFFMLSPGGAGGVWEDWI